MIFIFLKIWGLYQALQVFWGCTANGCGWIWPCHHPLVLLYILVWCKLVPGAGSSLCGSPTPSAWAGMPLLLIHPIITPKPLCTCGIPELLPLSVAHEGCPHHSRGTVPLTVPLPSLQLQPGPSSSQEASETFVWAVQSDWDEAPAHPPAPPETTQGHG